jgi:hypothetical protein
MMTKKTSSWSWQPPYQNDEGDYMETMPPVSGQLCCIELRLPFMFQFGRWRLVVDPSVGIVDIGYRLL